MFIDLSRKVPLLNKMTVCVVALIAFPELDSCFQQKGSIVEHSNLFGFGCSSVLT